MFFLMFLDYNVQEIDRQKTFISLELTHYVYCTFNGL